MFKIKQFNKKTTSNKAILLWPAIFVPNLIVLLGVYPGFFVYDAQDELMEVVTRTFNTHHPLVHVLAMGGTITGIHKLTDSWNLGIFIYLALQALLISAIYAYILQRISSVAPLPASTANESTAVQTAPAHATDAVQTDPAHATDAVQTDPAHAADAVQTDPAHATDAVQTDPAHAADAVQTDPAHAATAPALTMRAVIIFTLWYALFPTVVMYTLCSTKDGLFSAFATLFVMELALFLDAARPGIRSWLVLILSSAAMMLLRNNAVYALAVFAILLAIGSLISRVFGRKKVSSKTVKPAEEQPAETQSAEVQHSNPQPARHTPVLPIILSIIIAFVLYFVANKALIAVLHASDAEHQESITVAIQAIGRAWDKSPESFSDEDAAELKNWFTEEGLAGYEDRNSDFIKSTFNNERYETNAGDFWSLWFRIGKKCPAVYLESWVLTSSGMWNPFGVINTYEGHQVFTFTYTESSYFGYETELPGVRTPLIPAIDEFYRWLSLDDDIQRIPVLSLLFAPAFWFWVYAAAGIYLLCRKRSRALIPLLPLYLLWLTYLIGPASLVRYALPFFTALPVLAYLLKPSQAPAGH